MKRAAPLILLVCLSVQLAGTAAHAARLNYTLYVLGLPVADAELGVDLSASTYRMTFRFHTTGLVDVVAGDRQDEHTSGRFEGGRPAVLEYGANGHLHGNDRVVGLTWRDGTPIVTTIIPPNEGEREDVPVALRAHTMDPLSAIVLLLHEAAQIGRCEDSARAYDGRRLQVFVSKTAGEEVVPPSSRSSFSGRALRCDFTDQTLAGFRLGSGRDDDLRTHKGTIWLGQILPGGPPLPVRAAVETRWMGDAMIYLTSASP
jgi:hypothetical protein